MPYNLQFKIQRETLDVWYNRHGKYNANWHGLTDAELQQVLAKPFPISHNDMAFGVWKNKLRFRITGKPIGLSKMKCRISLPNCMYSPP